MRNKRKERETRKENEEKRKKERSISLLCHLESNYYVTIHPLSSFPMSLGCGKSKVIKIKKVMALSFIG